MALENFCNFAGEIRKRRHSMDRQTGKKELSILIPNYNNVCVSLVETLQRQAEALGIDYEIIVADDASPDLAPIDKNRAINALPHCHYTVRRRTPAARPPATISAATADTTGCCFSTATSPSPTGGSWSAMWPTATRAW